MADEIGILPKIKSISEKTDVMVDKQEHEKEKLVTPDDYLRNIDDNMLKIIDKKNKHKHKKFKLKGKVAKKLKKISTKSYVGVIILKQNHGMDITYLEYVDGYVYYNKAYHKFQPINIFMYKDKLPFGIFDEWSNLFWDVTKKYESDNRIGDKAEIQKLIINKASESKVVDKKGFGGVMVWLLILGGVALLAYVIFANMKKGG